MSIRSDLIIAERQGSSESWLSRARFWDVKWLVTVFWVMHLTATAAIILGWLISLIRTKLGLAMLAWGARLQIVIGLILVNLTFADGLNYARMIVKVMLAMIVVAMAEIAHARFKAGRPSRVLPAAAAILAAMIAVLSFLWH